MYYYRSIVILVLLNLYCYASPVPSIDQNQETTLLKNLIKQPIVSKTNDEYAALHKLHEYEFLRMLCELYDHCDDEQQQQQQPPSIDYHDIKHKRLSSRLFHGIPKFGKRAFSSAFAGIPKFG